MTDDSQGERRDPREVLRERFPDLVPASPPSLFTLNGCGVSIYGSRDHDPETGTYVRTTFLTLLFIPVLALSSWRVADAPNGGWYFLGKQPLSGVAALWNKLVVAAGLTLALMAGWNAHTSTPAYKAEQALASAREVEAKGDLEGAARGYASLLGGSRRGEAGAALRGILGRTPPLDLKALTAVLVALGEQARSVVDPPMLESLKARVEAARADDPRGGTRLADALRLLDEEAWKASREPLLEALLAKEPRDVAAAGELAALLEARDQGERAVALLRPLAAELGSSEGARILGTALATEGDLEGSHRLLLPYVEARLTELHEATSAFESLLEVVQSTAFESLRAGAATSEWYARHRAATEDEQDRMVTEWVSERVQTDHAVKTARDRVDRVGGVIPVALDLGIVKLSRAQGLAGQARTDELLAAERLFLAIQGVAKEAPAFKLTLAQIYYWLGRGAEGHALLDEQLAADRSVASLLAVARVLREVGVRAECAKLTEEAWEKGATDEEKHGAAGMRSVLARGVEDRITWLERAGDSTPIQANLHEARGQLALQKGDRVAGERALREALRLQSTLPETAVTLNNRAVTICSIYEVTRDPADFDAWVETLERAERLDQQNTILAFNLATALVSRAAARTIGDQLDLRALESSPSPGRLAWLYRDARGRDAVEGALVRHPDLVAARTRLERLHVTAPKEAEAWRVHQDLLELGAGDAPGLEAMLRQAEAADIDPGEHAGELQTLASPPDEDDIAAAHRWAERLEERRAGWASAGPVTRAVGLDDLALAWLGVHVLEAARAPEATGTGSVQDGAAPGATPPAARPAGPPVSLERVLQLAEEAHALAPSLGTHGVLMTVLMTRGAERVEAASPAFQAMRRRVGRALSVTSLVPAGLQGPDPDVRAALAADPDIRRAADLVVERGRAFPEQRTPWDWAFLEPIHPDVGAEAAAWVKQNAPGDVRRRLSLLCNPAEAQTVLKSSWAARIRGDQAAATKVLEEGAARGLLLPY